MEEIKAKFEESNSQRAWFVSGGYVDADTPEGFVYGDFTTDMCWTCFFEAYSSQDKVIKSLKGLIQEAHTWVDYNNYGGYDAYELRDRLAGALEESSK